MFNIFVFRKFFLRLFVFIRIVCMYVSVCVFVYKQTETPKKTIVNMRLFVFCNESKNERKIIEVNFLVMEFCKTKNKMLRCRKGVLRSLTTTNWNSVKMYFNNHHHHLPSPVTVQRNYKFINNFLWRRPF